RSSDGRTTSATTCPIRRSGTADTASHHHEMNEMTMKTKPGGEIASLDNEGAVSINVARLIETRALVQANSGAGKTWLLRRLLEQTHGVCQQLVIDPE